MVDLRTCNEGDLLVTKHGLILRYIRPCGDDSYYDHDVEYINSNFGNGTRTHSGHVFKNNRKSEDQDIVKIIKWESIFDKI